MVARVRRCDDDGGQVWPLLVLVVLVSLGAAVGLGRLGLEVVERARARTAADAAALAGVTGGRTAAERVARADGGHLVRFTSQGGATEVQVQVGGFAAWARARAGSPSPGSGGGPPDRRRPRAVPDRADTAAHPSAARAGPPPRARRGESQVDQGGLAGYGPIRSKRGYSSVG